MSTRIALIAHDIKKDDIVTLAGEYVDTLARCEMRRDRHDRLAHRRRRMGSRSSACCPARTAATCRSARNWRKGAWTW